MTEVKASCKWFNNGFIQILDFYFRKKLHKKTVIVQLITFFFFLSVPSRVSFTHSGAAHAVFLLHMYGRDYNQVACEREVEPVLLMWHPCCDRQSQSNQSEAALHCLCRDSESTGRDEERRE